MKKFRLVLLGLALLLVGCNRSATDDVLLKLQNDTELKEILEADYLESENLKINAKIEEAYYMQDTKFGFYKRKSIFVKAETKTEPIIELPPIEVTTSSYKKGKKDAYDLGTWDGYSMWDLKSSVVQDFITYTMDKNYNKPVRDILASYIDIQQDRSDKSFWYTFNQSWDDIADTYRDEILDAYNSEKMNQWTEKDWQKYYTYFIKKLCINVAGRVPLEELDVDSILKDLSAILPDGSFYMLGYNELEVGRKCYYFEVKDGDYTILQVT